MMEDHSACRVCLQPVTEYVNHKSDEIQLGNVENSAITYEIAFQICSGYSISDTEPQVFCEECSSELLISLNFKQKCVKTQQEMTNWLQSRIKIEDLPIKDEIFAENLSFTEDFDTQNDENYESDSNFHSEIASQPENRIKKCRGKYRSKENRSLKCDLCVRMYIERNNLLQHYNMKHPEAKTDPCEHCNHFQYPQFMASHVDRCGRRPRNLRHSGKKVTPRINLNFSEDIETQNDENDENDSNFSSEMESQSENQMKNRRGKYRSKENRSHKCDLCDRMYIERNNLLQHYNMKHPEAKTDPCEHCNHLQYPQLMTSHIEFCRTRLKKLRHAGKVRAPIRGPYKRRIPGEKPIRGPTQKGLCPICGDEKSQNHIKIHLQRQACDNQPFICDICGAQLASRTGIFFHMQIQHLKIPFSCRYCDKKFRTGQQVESHTRKIHPQFKKVLKCEFCDYTTNYHTSLRTHRAKHTGKTFHKCQTCGKEFIQKEKYKFHIALHSDERNFACEICGARFKTRRYVRVHQRTHQEKNYECPVCRKMFSSNQLLTSHVKNKHPEYQLPPPGTIMSKSYRKIMAEKKLKEEALRKGADQKTVDAIVVHEAPPIEELHIIQNFGAKHV